VVSFLHVSPPKPYTWLSPPHPSYMPRPSHSVRIYHLHKSRWVYTSWSSSLWSFLHSPVILSVLRPNILLNTIWINLLDQVKYIIYGKYIEWYCIENHPNILLNTEWINLLDQVKYIIYGKYIE
jgi:hypothetical protein